jgi:hypothetical protein
VSTFQLVERPPSTANYKSRSRYRDAGILVAITGLMVVAVATVANLIVGNDPASTRHDTLSWSFGASFAGFNVILIGIAIVLMGIIVRLWMRVDSVKAALSSLRAAPPEGPAPTSGTIKTDFGRAEVTPMVPRPLLIHRLAEAMWTPLLVMAPMVTAAGLVLSIVQANWTVGTDKFRDLGLWASGTEVLGLALMLGAISFVLGTILSSLRKGGGEVQESVGVSVETLKVPVTVWAFLGLMVAGMMAAIGQFVLAIVAANLDNPGSWFSWLQPLGLFSLGLLLSGVVLALYSIGSVLGFQFSRIREIIATGR